MSACGDLINSYIVLANAVHNATAVEIFSQLKKLVLNNSDVSEDVKNKIMELAKKYEVKL